MQSNPDSNLTKFIKKYQNIFFLCLTIITGLFFVLPLSNFQAYLAQGDHGRELYGYWLTSQGGLPYRDFTHMFGPFMPEYFGLLFNIFGATVQTALLGQNLFIVLNGVLIYLICKQFSSNLFSYTFATVYWGLRDFEFFYTYNHTAGIFAILGVVYMLIRYLNSYSIKFLYAGFTFSALLMLIRLNMGIAFWFGFGLCVILIHILDQKPMTPNMLKHFFISALCLPIPVALIYGILLYGLPNYAIYQSFPWGNDQRTDVSHSITQCLINLREYVISIFSRFKSYIVAGWAIILSSLYIGLMVLQKKFTEPSDRKLLIQSLLLGILIILGLHEFLASSVYYRVEWVIPIFFILLGTMLQMIFNKGNKIFSLSIVQTTILILILVLSYNKFNSYLALINKAAKPTSCLNWNGSKVCTFQEPAWFLTVYQTLDFIDKNIPSNEPIFCVPYDALYLFLTKHKSPTREIMLFQHFRIPPEQDKAIVDTLEKKHVKWVIISNRAISIEDGMGVLGQDYCPQLAAYLEKNFEIVKGFGQWNNQPSWAWNHATRILRRKLF
ncbi:MAG: hypothetical protein HQL25_04315 [Candidatus Omnitrophica bacterium]|nr:hypothetical protein [Candidatus Omnitrophota bacterium]